MSKIPGLLLIGVPQFTLSAVHFGEKPLLKLDLKNQQTIAVLTERMVLQIVLHSFCVLKTQIRYF